MWQVGEHSIHISIFTTLRSSVRCQPSDKIKTSYEYERSCNRRTIPLCEKRCHQNGNLFWLSGYHHGRPRCTCCDSAIGSLTAQLRTYGEKTGGRQVHSFDSTRTIVSLTNTILLHDECIYTSFRKTATSPNRCAILICLSYLPYGSTLGKWWYTRTAIVGWVPSSSISVAKLHWVGTTLFTLHDTVLHSVNSHSSMSFNPLLEYILKGAALQQG